MSARLDENDCWTWLTADEAAEFRAAYERLLEQHVLPRAHRVDDLAAVLVRVGWNRSSARVLAVLATTNEPRLSAAELAAALGASAGAVSTATRDLIGRGDIREVMVSGSRRRLVRLHERLAWLERFHQRMETEWAEHLRERTLP